MYFIIRSMAFNDYIYNYQDDTSINNYLNEESTYLDLSNQTLLYALLGREKPVYINQSPGLLSGEQSQQLFIEQIEKYEHGVPVVLKAKDKLLSEILDGISFVISIPLRKILPEFAFSIPINILRRVVLPQPDAPSIDKNSPS